MIYPKQMTTETHKFEAEISQLMNLIVNAFYSNKDVFLRELISNASDALDKVRYIIMTGQECLNKDQTYEIKIVPDKVNKALIISDTGIGMTKDELIKNLGTVARSGTKNFMEALKDKDKSDLNMIGQFGVGFYSAYLVGSRLEVVSKSVNGDKAYKWESSADGTFTVSEFSENFERGTKITIYLKEKDMKYLEDGTLKKIVEQHSNYITYPILLYSEKKREKETEKEKETDENKAKIEDDVEDTDKEKEKEKEMETYYEYDKINKQDPLWIKSSSEINETMYKEFYKNFSNDWDEYLFVNHFKAEGSLEFTCLLFIPKMAPHDMFKSKEWAKGVKLYVRRVFITDKCDELIPEYLSFMKGVVDSNDLPLNVSREMLQHNKVMKKMKKYIVKKMVDMLVKYADDTDKYKTFYEQYSKNIKLGIYEDADNKDKLVRLLRYFSIKHKDSQISFDQYVKEMQPGQKNIYYITGESMATLEDSPFLESLRKRNMDVMFFVDPIDEYAVQQMREFEDKKLVDVTKEDLKLEKNEEDNSSKEKEQEEEKEYDALCKFMKNLLGDSVEKVKISKRELESPCILTTGQFGWSANMERIMKTQTLQKSDEMMNYMRSKKTMELNHKHNLVKILKDKYNLDSNDKTVKDLVWLFYETALMTSGFTLEKPASYANRIFNMISLGLSGGLPEEYGVNFEDKPKEDKPKEDKPKEDKPKEEMPNLEKETNMEKLD